MKILITQAYLERRGGSELFVIEVAAELTRLGHHVGIYTGEIGVLAEELVRHGVDVFDDPRKCPWIPDIIHGQHRMYALKAMMAFPNTPAILYLHGFIPRHEKPFVHPRLLKYITPAHSLVKRWSDGLGLSPARFEVIKNHIDLRRFSKFRNPPKKPRSALLYSNGRFEESQIATIREVCLLHGISFKMAGPCVGEEVTDPENLLVDYDLVFAVGRSALEAAACGCGVILVYQGMADELLLPDNYQRLRDQNMAVRFFDHEKLTPEWINGQINKWNPSLISEASQSVREDARLEKTVNELERIYGSVMTEYARTPLANFDLEIDALTKILTKEERDSIRWMQRVQKVQKIQAIRIKRMKGQIISMHQSLSWRITAPLRWLGNLG